MRSYLANAIAAILVEFRDGGEPFIPVSGSVSWSLRDHSGTLVTGFVNLALTPGVTDTSVLIQVPALQNEITSPREFEKRTVIVSASKAGTPWQAVIPYRITPWLNHSVTADSARALAGLDRSELPDAELDIYAAYKWVEDKLGVDTLETALASGTSDETDANRAIAARAVLVCLSAVASRVLKRRTDGSLEAERFEFDVGKLRVELQALIDTVLINLAGSDIEEPGLFSFGTPTDPITGA